MQRESFHLSLETGVSTRGDRGVAAPLDEIFPVARSRQLPRPHAEAATLAVYAERWLAAVGAGLRPRTLESYRAQLRLHVLPLLGERPVGELTAEDLLLLIEEMQSAGYTAWTIRTALTPVSRLLNHAVRRGVIEVNPMSKLERNERPAVWRGEQKILKRQEIARLLDGAPSRFRTLIAAAVFTGTRQGELLGLTWADVDFDGGVVKVRRSLDRQGRLVDPKTRHAIRDVVLMPALSRTLQKHRENSRYTAPDDYVFASQRGTPLYWRNVARRGLQPALANAGLEHLRWHDLRHTFASLLIAQGANIVYVSRQLGHGSSDITLRCYGHLFDRAEYEQRTRNALEDAFGSLL